MSSQNTPYTFENDAWDEIKDKQETLKNAIFAEAIYLVYKDGHTHVDKTYIRKASKRIKWISSSQKIVWSLRILLLILLPLVIAVQISGLLFISEVSVIVQFSLWLLPLFSVFLIIILSWVFWDLIS